MTIGIRRGKCLFFPSNGVSMLAWTNGSGGLGTEGGDGLTWDGGEGPIQYEFFWPVVSWPQWESPGVTWWNWQTDQWDITTNSSDTGPAPAMEHCNSSYYQNFYVSPNWTYTLDEQRTADAEMKLATGGPLGSTAMNLWVISASMTGYTNLLDAQGYPIPFDQIQIGSLGHLDTNGNFYVVLPDNDPASITPKVNGLDVDKYPALSATEYPLVHLTEHPAWADTNRARTNLGVAEEVDFSGMPTNTMWSVSAGGLSATNGSAVKFTAPSNAPAGGVTATVTATVRGEPLNVDFTVVPPSGHGTTFITGTNHFPVGYIGAGMTNLLVFNPTNVSFYQVFTWELPAGITNVTGYFTNYLTSQFPSLGIGEVQLDTNNSLTDKVISLLSNFHSYSLPLYSGSWDFVITNMWTIPGSLITNHLATFTMTSSLLDSNGNFSVTKNSYTITRSTNDVSHSGP